MIVGVGHIDVAGAIHRYARGIIEPRIGTRPVIGAGYPARPARVVTTPAGVILRMIWLQVSTT